MLVEGMSFASLIDAMFSAPLAHREAVRSITDGLDDFIISPDLGLMWHLRYIYGDQRFPACRGYGDRHPGRDPCQQGRLASSVFLKLPKRSR